MRQPATVRKISVVFVTLFEVLFNIQTSFKTLCDVVLQKNKGHFSFLSLWNLVCYLFWLIEFVIWVFDRVSRPNEYFFEKLWQKKNLPKTFIKKLYNETLRSDLRDEVFVKSIGGLERISFVNLKTFFPKFCGEKFSRIAHLNISS